jgi:hypothetical protein
MGWDDYKPRKWHFHQVFTHNGLIYDAALELKVGGITRLLLGSGEASYKVLLGDYDTTLTDTGYKVPVRTEPGY